MKNQEINKLSAAKRILKINNNINSVKLFKHVNNNQEFNIRNMI